MPGQICHYSYLQVGNYFKMFSLNNPSFHRGIRVAIKRINLQQITLNRHLLIELKQIKVVYRYQVHPRSIYIKVSNIYPNCLLQPIKAQHIKHQPIISSKFFSLDKVANLSSLIYSLSSSFQMYLSKDLQHDNLVRFYGACLDPIYPALVTEYCPRGSLQVF